MTLFDTFPFALISFLRHITLRADFSITRLALVLTLAVSGCPFLSRFMSFCCLKVYSLFWHSFLHRSLTEGAHCDFSPYSYTPHIVSCPSYIPFFSPGLVLQDFMIAFQFKIIIIGGGGLYVLPCSSLRNRAPDRPRRIWNLWQEILEWDLF